MFETIQSKYGGLDVCVNNAGLMQKAPLLSGDTEHWREMLDVSILHCHLQTSSSSITMMKLLVSQWYICYVNDDVLHRK